MSVRIAFACLIVAFSPLLANPMPPAQPRPHRYNEAITPYHETREGMIKPLQSIEATVVPQMKRQGAAYIGAEYDAQALRYRLKFMNDGSVIWVDVDGRNGAVVAQSGR